jgi:hypothetical protein
MLEMVENVRWGYSFIHSVISFIPGVILACPSDSCHLVALLECWMEATWWRKLKTRAAAWCRNRN